jgi:hypothetical protein
LCAESQSWRSVLDTILCDKVCLWLATGRWFSPGPPVSSTNKTNSKDIIEILLKVALNTMIITPYLSICSSGYEQWSLFRCHLAFAWSVLRYTAPDYAFTISNSFNVDIALNRASKCRNNDAFSPWNEIQIVCYHIVLFE